MKKILMAFALVVMSSTYCSAGNTAFSENTDYQKQVMETGFKILNANRINRRVVFRFKDNKKANAFAIRGDNSVLVLKGIMPYFDDEAELAGILSHEIAHNMDFYDGHFKSISMKFARKKYEMKADKKGVDYMVKAGYNPVAMIIALNKFIGEQGGGIFSSHPRCSKRLAYIYEYIYLKYPAFLVDNEYRTNIYYQNFLLTSKWEREKIRAKNNRKSKTRVS